VPVTVTGEVKNSAAVSLSLSVVRTVTGHIDASFHLESNVTTRTGTRSADSDPAGLPFKLRGCDSDSDSDSEFH
jgi:hypothetical protein